MTIAFMDLKTQYGLMSDEIRAGIDNVLQHGRYIMGPEVSELEARLAKFTGVKHAISCSSGTDALLMPLMAFGIGPGRCGFHHPLYLFCHAEVIALLGATPVFVDIDPHTFNIDPDALEEAVSRVEREGKLVPKGIIPVDLFGLPADYQTIQAIADRHGLFVIEDAAQSHWRVLPRKTGGQSGPGSFHQFLSRQTLGLLWGWRQYFHRRRSIGRNADLHQGPWPRQGQVSKRAPWYQRPPGLYPSRHPFGETEIPSRGNRKAATR